MVELISKVSRSVLRQAQDERSFISARGEPFDPDEIGDQDRPVEPPVVPTLVLPTRLDLKLVLAGGLGLFLLLLLACRADRVADIPAVPPSSPNTTEAAALPPPALTPPPLIAPMAPSASPGSPVPSPVGSPGYSSELTTTATPTPIPQTAALKLEVTSPRDNAVVRSQIVAVAGLTSPDAAVSVNGRLVTPDPDGRFAADLFVTLADNPLPIEVIATSISGEQRWLVLTVIYIP